MLLTPEVLRESVAARNGELVQISSADAIEIIQEIKPIKFTKWAGIDFVTVPQIAHFLNSSPGAIRYKLRRSYQAEFNQDGVKCLADKQESREAHYALNASKNDSQMIICPPKAILRLAMLLSLENPLALKIVEFYINCRKTKEGYVNNSNDSELRKQIANLSQIVASSQEQWLKTNQALAQITSSLMPVKERVYQENRVLDIQDELAFQESESDSIFVYESVNNHHTTLY